MSSKKILLDAYIETIDRTIAAEKRLESSPDVERARIATEQIVKLRNISTRLNAAQTDDEITAAITYAEDLLDPES